MNKIVTFIIAILLSYMAVSPLQAAYKCTMEDYNYLNGQPVEYSCEMYCETSERGVNGGPGCNGSTTVMVFECSKKVWYRKLKRKLSCDDIQRWRRKNITVVNCDGVVRTGSCDR